MRKEKVCYSSPINSPVLARLPPPVKFHLLVEENNTLGAFSSQINIHWLSFCCSYHCHLPTIKPHRSSVEIFFHNFHFLF